MNDHKYIPSRNIQNAIINVLTSHQGANNRIKRSSLRYEVNEILAQHDKFTTHTPGEFRLVHLTDRGLRLSLEYLRHQPKGALICSLTHSGGGYFMAVDKDELERHLLADRSRAMKTLARIRAQSKNAGLEESAQLAMDLPIGG